MTTTPFGTRLAESIDEYGHLCVGLDPHPGMLTDWGLSEDAAGLREFGQRVLEACAGRVGVIKPQVAFYERYGPEGMAVLAETTSSAKEAGLMVIGDAKRGDIGSTMAAYAEAWLNPANAFSVDALTVSPYLGFGSLAPAVQAAQDYGAGLFVLGLTSNPEGAEVQLATAGETGQTSAELGKETVVGSVIAQAAAVNGAPERLGDIGLVIGATTVQLAAEHGIDLSVGRPPILAPGYGAQGATAAQIRTGFAGAWDQVLVNSSRGILSAGPGVSDLVSSIASSRADLD